jgi:hypothetical protein
MAWEIKLVEPHGSNFKQSVLQCASCGVPVGALDFYNVGALLKGQEKTLAALQQAVASISATVQDIQHIVRRNR